MVVSFLEFTYSHYIKAHNLPNQIFSVRLGLMHFFLHKATIVQLQKLLSSIKVAHIEENKINDLVKDGVLTVLELTIILWPKVDPRPDSIQFGAAAILQIQYG